MKGQMIMVKFMEGEATVALMWAVITMCVFMVWLIRHMD